MVLGTKRRVREMGEGQGKERKVLRIIKDKKGNWQINQREKHRSCKLQSGVTTSSLGKHRVWVGSIESIRHPQVQWSGGI